MTESFYSRIEYSSTGTFLGTSMLGAGKLLFTGQVAIGLQSPDNEAFEFLTWAGFRTVKNQVQKDLQVLQYYIKPNASFRFHLQNGRSSLLASRHRLQT